MADKLFDNLENRENNSLNKFSGPNQRFIGNSIAVKSVIETVDTIAPRECSVIIVGETGTGKEMVARKIHQKSTRCKNVFVPVDCTSLTGNLFESQLFGHVKGAFTGAMCDTLGFFRAAHKGTIFLDEIGELNQNLQAKLLRVLQESVITPVGSTTSYSVDVRVICATNKDLKQMVKEGLFRADLYFRLNVVQVELPPLRQRKVDILILAKHFLNKQAELYNEPSKKLTSEAIDILKSYNWPGNVRELANAMERAFVLCDDKWINPSVLPTDILIMDILPQSTTTFPSLEQIKEKLVIKALKASNGRKMAAARLLKIDHRKLSRLLKKYNLQQNRK